MMSKSAVSEHIKRTIKTGIRYTHSSFSTLFRSTAYTYIVRPILYILSIFGVIQFNHFGSGVFLLLLVSVDYGMLLKDLWCGADSIRYSIRIIFIGILPIFLCYHLFSNLQNLGDFVLFTVCSGSGILLFWFAFYVESYRDSKVLTTSNSPEEITIQGLTESPDIISTIELQTDTTFDSDALILCVPRSKVTDTTDSTQVLLQEFYSKDEFLRRFVEQDSEEMFGCCVFCERDGLILPASLFRTIEYQQNPDRSFISSTNCIYRGLCTECRSTVISAIVSDPTSNIEAEDVLVRNI